MTTTAPVPQTDTAPPGGAGPARPLGLLGWLRWGWRQLTSMRIALVLLLLLGLAAVPGSVLPQRGQGDDAVARFFADHPKLAPILDRLSAFDVFAAPWFAAIYLLLFVSLTGCVVPRSWKYVRAVRRLPAPAPRDLSRLPQVESYRTTSSPDQVLAAAAKALRGRRFRVAAGDGWVSAEKGYLHEIGNLLFHLALLGVLCALGLGALYGYRGNVLVVEGEGFANTIASYDAYRPGAAVPESLRPFSFTVTDFTASYAMTGAQRGQPLDFGARLRVREGLVAPERSYHLRVNHPLRVGGAKVYLLGHGYAPTFTVTDGNGRVAFQGPVPFLAAEQRTYTSEGVIKVPDAEPEQLGFLGLFLPTTVPGGSGGFASAFPAPLNPTVTLFPFTGNLGLDSGLPQSVYQLDTRRLTRVEVPVKPLAVGETLRLPGDAGQITFTGVREWVSLQVTYDPGRMAALIAGGLAVVAVLLSLYVRRRRIWVRARADQGRTVVEVGGLARTEGGRGFGAEFAEIVKNIKG